MYRLTSSFLPIIVILGQASCQQSQGAVTGLSTSIPCDHGRQEEAPFWFINNIVYELFSIPQYFPSIPVVTSYTSLNIPNVTSRVDNTVFRCATFDRNGELTSPDNAVRLLVTDVGNPGEVREQRNTFTFDYQRLDIDDKISVGWSSTAICSEIFELQGFTIADNAAVATGHVIQVGNSSHSTQIPIDKLSIENGSDIHYRLVAVSENGTVCSDITSQQTFYKFQGIYQMTHVASPLSPLLCFTLPERSVCSVSLYFIWPQREEGLSCLCPVYDSSDGRSVFESCSRGCDTNIVPRLVEGGQVCLPGIMSSINKTTSFHFMCSTDPCTEECFVKHLISVHRVTLSDEFVPLVGLGSRVDILCNIDITLGGFPHWLLNDTVYTLASLLQTFPSFTSQDSVNHTLTIVAVTPEINNTLFRCGIFDGQHLVFGSSTRIIIDPNIDESDGEVAVGNDTSIPFNYQELVVETSGIQIGWSVTKFICSPLYEVQNTVLSSTEPPKVSARTNLTHYNISSDQLTNSFLFRIVAVFENGTVCSNSKSQSTLYNFSEIRQTNRTYGRPNSTFCFDVPEDTDPIITWDKQCMCGVYYIGEYPCGGCDAPAANKPYTRNNSSQVCFNDTNFSLNGMLVHYLHTRPPPQCSGDDCNTMINTILSSYRIIVAEPPSEPKITYNNGFLCINTNSSIDVSIQFSISTTEGSMSTKFSGPSRCFSDPFPIKCTEFNVTVSASNAVGTSNHHQQLTSIACDTTDMPMTDTTTTTDVPLPNNEVRDGVIAGVVTFMLIVIGVGLTVLAIVFVYYNMRKKVDIKQEIYHRENEEEDQPEQIIEKDTENL